jgi:renalase
MRQVARMTARCGPPGEALLGSSADVSDSTVLVAGGGFAGVGAAAALVAAGVDVVLCEQGRGLGGRVCTRHVRDSRGLCFDHGCQYFAPKPGSPFVGLLADLEMQGVVKRWALGRLGTVECRDQRLEATTFTPWETGKVAWVGVPSMSSVGKHLLVEAARQPGAGQLTVALGTRVAPGTLRRDDGAWLAETHGKSTPDERRSTRHAYVLAMGSASSTFNVISSVSPQLAAPAGQVQANCCWALMVAFAQPMLGAGGAQLPFDGCLVQGSEAIAWIANNSSKPGRASGSVECWVVHAAAEWSNARRNADADAVAGELLAAFTQCMAHASPGMPAVVHREAFRWNAAFPLSVADSGGASCFVDGDAGIGLGGDWCVGPRAGDAWHSGRMVAQAVLRTMAAGRV